MAPESFDLRQQRARLAGLARRASKDPALCAELAQARANYHESKLADYIKKTVDAAPPLTAEQRDRLAALLRVSA